MFNSIKNFFAALFASQPVPAPVAKPVEPVQAAKPLAPIPAAPVVAPLNHLAPYHWAQNEMKTHDTQEVAGNKDNPRIIWYHSHTTLKASHDEVAWCSAFMCTAAEESGFPSTKSAAAVSWATYGVPGDGSIGDIVVFKRTGGHHVAFINQPYKKGDRFVNILGGNQGNRVCVENHDASSIIAVRRFTDLPAKKAA